MGMKNIIIHIISAIVMFLSFNRLFVYSPWSGLSQTAILQGIALALIAIWIEIIGLGIKK